MDGKNITLGGRQAALGFGSFIAGTVQQLVSIIITIIILILILILILIMILIMILLLLIITIIIIIIIIVTIIIIIIIIIKIIITIFGLVGEGKRPDGFRCSTRRDLEPFRRMDSRDKSSGCAMIDR